MFSSFNFNLELIFQIEVERREHYLFQYNNNIKEAVYLDSKKTTLVTSHTL